MPMDFAAYSDRYADLPADSEPPSPPQRMLADRWSNAEIGSLIGIGRTGVSRIRSGERRPSIETMRRIQRATDWSFEDQVRSRETNRYAVDFEKWMDKTLSSMPWAPTPQMRLP